MKYSIAVKFVAVLLCALLLTGIVGTGASLAALTATGMFSGKTVEQIKREQTENRVRWYAEEIANFSASEYYGEMPKEVADAGREETASVFFEPGTVACTVCDAEGNELYSEVPDGEVVATYRFDLDRINFQHFAGYQTEEPTAEDVYDYGFYSEQQHRQYVYHAYTDYADNITIEVGVTDAVFRDEVNPDWELLTALESHKVHLIVGFIACLLLCAACVVYLCASAGRSAQSSEIRAAGLNALPLDLYLGGVLFSWVMMAVMLNELDLWLGQQGWKVLIAIFGGLGFVACLGFVGFCFAFAAQIKMKGGRWWRNTICARCIKLAIRILRWVFRLLPRVVKACWKVAAALLTLGWGVSRRGLNWCWKHLRRWLRRAEEFFSLLPLTWQWMLVGIVLLLWLAGSLYRRVEEMFFLGCLAGFLIVCYGAHAFGSLFAAVKRMRGGELESKVDDRILVGAFREFAGELNGLADVAMVAAQKQLKSERMKTELITNVSHDIKTPLTSIINYVDLLEKPHSDEEEKAYLEVLHRQSQRMKKLIEDLMEMSKASTGNISVEISQIDAVEAVNQALGEFTDKLTAAGLTPVFHQPEEAVTLLADGRLLWRAMSNILSNAVKYAMPGTRLYVDVAVMENKVMISFKNISGAQLNISADELMERFVRGDSSRNTEGSGLGLNIAKSLMELQKGQLQLLVDGDLFKVTLVFPRG